jgi:hypothetical protein
MNCGRGMGRETYYRRTYPCPFPFSLISTHIKHMTKKIKPAKKEIYCLNKYQQHALKTKTNRKIGYDYSASVPIFLEKLMDEIVEYATKAGIDSYYLLRHYQFTNEEIEEYFDKLGWDIIY